MKRKTILYLMLIIGLLAGFAVGFSIGTYKSLDWCVEQGINLIEIKGYEIDIDKTTILLGLAHYRNQFENFINKSDNESVF